MIKRINKNGSVTLPKAARVESGLHGGVVVEVEASRGCVTIRTAHRTCLLCGNAVDVREVRGVVVCEECAHEIVEVFGHE